MVKQQIAFWEDVYLRNPEGARSGLYRIPIPNKPGQLVLDIGSGDFGGLDNTLYSNPNARFVGSDISRNALLLVDKRQRVAGKYNPVRSLAQYLPFKNSSFDEVFTNNAISFMGEYVPDAIREMARVTKSVVTFGVFHVDILKNTDVEGVVKHFDWGTVHYADGLHRALFTENQVERMIRSNGLGSEVIDTLTMYEFSNAAPWERIDPSGNSKYMIFVNARKI